MIFFLLKKLFFIIISGCVWCEETLLLGGEIYTTIFASSSDDFAKLDFLHFAGHNDRVAFADFLSTKLLVIECTFVLITVSMY